MPNLKIVNIMPNTRVAVFRGSGDRHYTDDDIILLKDNCIYQVNLNNLPVGEYFVRSIHAEYLFENVDVDLTEDVTIRIKNKIDPTSVDSIKLTKYMLDEYIEKSTQMVTNSDVDLDSDNPIDEALISKLMGLYRELRSKYSLRKI